MSLTDKVLAELGDPILCKQLRPCELRGLGYLLTRLKIPLGNQSGRLGRFVIHQVVDEDHHRPASFCFLFSNTTQMGVILNKTYEDFVSDSRLADG